ncbi:MAG TPA: ABC transporter ATP-binding protein [Armatimonadota bacterium]|jgi:cobalt/nickel transport system ATP-binding protein
MSDLVYDLSDVCYAYPDGTPALAGISLRVSPGERIALLGANGSGKSTLLRLLCALEYASSGSVQAFGRPLSEAAMGVEATALGFRRRVQFVFQDADIQLFSPTVEEEVAFGPLQLASDPGDVRAQVDDALANVSIPHLRSRAPHRLSGGEKRKVALASVLVLKPDVLLLDEPAAGLDPRSAGALIDILDAFAAAGGTILLATHDIPLLTEMADRAIVIGEDHRIHADGPVVDVLTNRPLLERCNLVHTHRARKGAHEH